MGKLATANRTTVVVEKAKEKALLERVIEYTAGNGAKIELDVQRARAFNFVAKTKSGHQAPDSLVYQFLKICKNNHLDPWDGDAYLLGYDTRNGPEFSIVTSHQSLLRRAEANEQYDGIEGGVVLSDGSEIVGTVVTNPDDSVVGGWAKVHRKDRKVPSYVTLELSVYNQNRSRWNLDPKGMITKCAKSAALREAFPRSLGGMVTDDEIRQDEVAIQPAAVELEPVNNEPQLIESDLGQPKPVATDTETIPEPPQEPATPKPKKLKLTKAQRAKAIQAIKDGYGDDYFKVGQKYGVQSLDDLIDDHIHEALAALEPPQ